MRQSLTLCLGVPYDIVQTNKKGEYNICVALDFVDVDGIVVIVDVAVAVTTVVVDAAATVDALAAAVTADAAVVALVVEETTAVAAAMISVQAPDARHTGKASAMAIGKASTMQPGAIQAAAAPPPARPEDLVQLSPKTAAAVTTNRNWQTTGIRNRTSYEALFCICSFLHTLSFLITYTSQTTIDNLPFSGI
ncbi:hypothetical protein [Enterocloster bolteae]|uniref:hypothetical protein n=1 Tax=Enterocloster bolteae TaxID=208479 RepID=UPI0039A17ABD